MCNNRIRSAFDSILRHRPFENLTPEISAQISRRSEIHPAAEQLRQLDLQPGHSEQTRRSSRLEFGQKIDIAVRPETIPQDRAIERQPPNVVPLTKSGDALSRKLDVMIRYGSPPASVPRLTSASL